MYEIKKKTKWPLGEFPCASTIHAYNKHSVSYMQQNYYPQLPCPLKWFSSLSFLHPPSNGKWEIRAGESKLACMALAKEEYMNCKA